MTQTATFYVSPRAVIAQVNTNTDLGTTQYYLNCRYYRDPACKDLVVAPNNVLVPVTCCSTAKLIVLQEDSNIPGTLTLVGGMLAQQDTKNPNPRFIAATPADPEIENSPLCVTIDDLANDARLGVILIFTYTYPIGAGEKTILIATSDPEIKNS